MEQYDLSWLLNPVDPHVFLAKYFDTCPLHIAHSDPHYLYAILREAQVEQLLQDAQHSPFIRVSIKHPDGPVPEEEYSHWTQAENVRVRGGIKLKALEYALFEKAATAVIDHAHRSFPSLEGVHSLLVALFQCTVTSRVSVRAPHAANFQPAFEVFDQFILQTTGGQHVRLYNPIVKSPLNHHAKNIVNANELDLVLDTQLNAGDVLYIPRGFIFEMLSVDTLSCHASFNVYNTTWAKIICDSVHTLGNRIDLLREGFYAANLRQQNKHALLQRIKAAIIDSLCEQSMALPEISQKPPGPFVKAQVTKALQTSQ
jgi:hypothetical protein